MLRVASRDTCEYPLEVSRPEAIDRAEVSAEAHPVVIIRTSEHHVLSRPRLSVRMFGSWGKKRANRSVALFA